MKKIILFYFAIILTNCISTKEEIKQYARGLECCFKVTNKTKNNRDFIFSGYNKNKKFIKFQIGQSWDMYKFVEPGDSIYKKVGETDIKLIKDDTTLVFKLMCHGEVIE